MHKKTYYIIGAAIVLIIFVWYFTGRKTSDQVSIKIPVKSGTFEINVSTTGELEAKKSENIYGPTGLRSIQIWSEIKINKLIDEGTVVDSGDFVASLDKTEVMSKLKDLENELEKLESQHTKTMLDTSLNLRNARNELVNLKFGMEEQQIVVDQSKFETPATQRQAKINLDKAERAYNQAVENYDLKFKKSNAEMQEVSATLQQAQRKRKRMIEILQSFEIFAPKSGMIIYKRNWRGIKRETGSTINSWDNVVAMLPDLSQMISKTYVNEIDISKVKTGQTVRIGVDAFPDKNYDGEVTGVANIGEQKPGSDAKVFEVIIDVNETDTILRPAMTTKNVIVTAIHDSVIYIPIEAIHNNDSITFVYKDKGKRIIKQQVETGRSNENDIIILKGLNKDEEVYITIPENNEDLKIVMNNN